jgi:hypothetical protein
MNKSTLATAVALGVLAQQAGAAGFIEDSKATLGLRNFYINTDFRDGTGPNKYEEWGQGFDLRFISGYTQGTVGFGVDAIGLLGVKLDSGGGTNGATSTSYGGTVFPSKSNGEAVDNFSSLGLTAKAKVSQTELKLGTQRWSSVAANLAGWPDHLERRVQGPDPDRWSNRAGQRS